MATSFGTSAGVFGIANQQTGFLLESTTETYSQDSATCKNITGDTIGEAYYDERIEGSMDGWLPSGSPFTGTLASALTLATTPADHLIGSVSGGTTIVRDITRSSTSSDYRRLALNWKYSPTILA
jgi:hypothetical protein